MIDLMNCRDLLKSNYKIARHSRLLCIESQRKPKPKPEYVIQYPNQNLLICNPNFKDYLRFSTSATACRQCLINLRLSRAKEENRNFQKQLDIYFIKQLSWYSRAFSY